MRALKILGVAAVITAAAASAGAQMTKTVPGETKLVTATVEAIDHGNREVTVKKSDGNYEVIYVPASIARFDALKIGDKVTTRYYETMVLRLKPAGEADVDTMSSQDTPADTLSGTTARQQTITATITAIDAKAPSITFTGPRGWNYSSHVKDKDALAKVKVGDKVDITTTAALVVSIEGAK